MGGNAWRFGGVTIVVRIVGGIEWRHAGGGLDRTLGRIDPAGRTRVGSHVHAVHVQSVRVGRVVRVRLDRLDDHLRPVRGRGEHRRRPHQ
jgi:hypothetical protein